MSTGFDYNRMSLLLAVLEKRAGYYFSNLDAYINVVGGLRLDEPAADLAVAMALVSSLKDCPIRDDAMVVGEVGLAGELRSVSRIEARISEAKRPWLPSLCPAVFQLETNTLETGGYPIDRC